MGTVDRSRGSQRFRIFSQNDCHSAAICSEVSGPEKYTCQCRDGYIDQSPNRNMRPGRICVEMVGFVCFPRAASAP